MASIPQPTDQSDQNISISQVGAEALSTVMDIMGKAFSDEYGEAWNLAQCSSMIGLRGTKMIMACQSEKPCGFAITRSIVGEEEVLMIAVDPAAQSAGIGRALMDHIIADAQNNGVNILFLEVRANNDAQKLYTQLGFEKIGIRRAYYTGSNNKKFDAITYRRALVATPVKC